LCFSKIYSKYVETYVELKIFNGFLMGKTLINVE